MRRFRFPLERVLWHRHRLEDLAHQALGRAQREEQEVLGELAEVQARSADAAATLRATLARPTAGDEVLLHARFVAGLAGRQAGLVGRRIEVAAQVEERRLALQERWRSREAVASLRARALARHRKAEERELQLALDETAGVRHTRREES